MMLGDRYIHFSSYRMNKHHFSDTFEYSKKKQSKIAKKISCIGIENDQKMSDLKISSVFSFSNIVKWDFFQ